MSEQEVKPEADTVPAIAITLQHELDANRRVVLQSYVAAYCTDAEFNAMFDKLSRASDRQNAKTTLPTTENLLQLKKQRLISEEERHFLAVQTLDKTESTWRDQGIASGRRDPKLSQTQVMEQTRSKAEIAKYDTNCKILKQEIEELELQVSMWKSKLGA